MYAIPCASDKRAGRPRAFAQVSEDNALSSCNRYVAGVAAPVPEDAPGDPCGIEAFYWTLGVVVSATVTDGDCGLDVTQRMLAQPGSYEGRVQLRIETSDYLMERVSASWMHEIMAVMHDDSFDRLFTATGLSANAM